MNLTDTEILEWLLSEVGSQWFYWMIEHGRKPTRDDVVKMLTT